MAKDRRTIGAVSNVLLVCNVVVCKASSPAESFKKIAAAAAILPAMIASSPAYALVRHGNRDSPSRSGDLDRSISPSNLSQVDERLNGDGTGKPLGINDEQLVFAMVGVFTLIWSLWFNGQKDLGDFDDVDDGLKID